MKYDKTNNPGVEPEKDECESFIRRGSPESDDAFSVQLSVGKNMRVKTVL